MSTVFPLVQMVRSLASGEFDDETVRLWDVSEGTLLRTLPIGASVNSVSFSPDGQTLANGHDSSFWKEDIHLWDVATGTFLRALEIPDGYLVEVNSVSFSPDGQTLASGNSDKTVQLWDVATGTLRHTFEGHLAGVNSVSRFLRMVRRWQVRAMTGKSFSGGSEGGKKNPRMPPHLSKSLYFHKKQLFWRTTRTRSTQRHGYRIS